MMPEFFMNLGKICCLLTYSNLIFAMLCYMHPNYINKVITYIAVFSMTILMMIGWFAHFGTIGKFITWNIGDKEYIIEFPRIGDDEIR